MDGGESLCRVGGAEAPTKAIGGGELELVVIPEEVGAVKAQPGHTKNYIHGAKGGDLESEVFGMGPDVTRIGGGGVSDVTCEDRPSINDRYREGKGEVLSGERVELDKGGVEESVRSSSVDEGLKSHRLGGGHVQRHEYYELRGREGRRGQVGSEVTGRSCTQIGCPEAYWVGEFPGAGA